jgi:lipopolysaccharide transport protein LptA
VSDSIPTISTWGFRAGSLFLKGTAILLSATAPATLYVASAQETNLQLPISVDADFFNYDGKNSMLTYRGLKLTQGNIGIQADIGRGSSLDFEDSVWEFSGNVLIDVQNGHIECDAANLKFSGHQLQWAEITGAPATFEMQRPESDVVTYAEAGKLEYDFTNSVVEFSENATISEGGNQISSNYLVYDIKEQRINAQSAGEGKPKVKIIYTPQDSAKPQTDEEDSSGENEESQNPGDRDGRR